MNILKAIMNFFQPTKDYSGQIIYWSWQAIQEIALARNSELICDEDKDVMTKVVEYWKRKSLEENTESASDRMYRIHKNNQIRFNEMERVNR